MDNVFDGYKCPICNGTLRITKRFLNCGHNEWHELNRIVCNHCKVKSGEMECDLKQCKEKYWHSFTEAVKRKKERETRKPEKILTDIRDYLVAIIDEWHRRSDEPNFLENNIMVYNHIRKELDDLTEYAEKLGVEL